MRRHADRLEHLPAGTGDGGHAAVKAGCHGRGRIGRVDHGAGHAMPPQRDGKRQADQAAAEDDDIEALHDAVSSAEMAESEWAISCFHPSSQRKLGSQAR